MLLFAIKERKMIMPLQNMCHAKTFSIRREPQPDPPQTQLQAYVEYTKYQWVLYNNFKEVVQNGHYGAYYQFLIEELDMGPYWSDVKFYYGQVHKEEEPETSDSEEETGSETGY